MNINIPYGKGKISLNIPGENILDIVSGDTDRFESNEDKVIEEALNKPIESGKL